MKRKGCISTLDVHFIQTLFIKVIVQQQGHVFHTRMWKADRKNVCCYAILIMQSKQIQ